MSEGTPGRAPDADTRAEDAQATTARPSSAQPAQPVRYGPRNGTPRSGANGAGTIPNGRGGANGRTVAAPGSPQQQRPPQPSRGPQTGPNGSGANGAGAHTPGNHGSSPASYTHPRPLAAPAQPAAGNDERRVADARTAAAARNASAAKAKGTSAPEAPAASGAPADAGPQDRAAEDRTVTGPPSDDTAVIPAVVAGSAVAPDREATPEAATSAPAEAPDKGRGFFGRLRDAGERLGAKGPADADIETDGGATAGATAVDQPAEETSDESAPRSDPDADVPEDEAVAERPLTWRERLGLAPKAPKPQPVEVPESAPGVPTAAAAAALAAGAAAGTEVPDTKAAPTGPTTAPQPTEPLGRVTPASPVPAVTSDTVVIPAVEAGAVAPAAPAAAATTQALVAAKPKVGVARRTRKARLRLSRVDPWSVMKTAFLFSIAAGIILVVATYGVWSVLNASGLFDAVNDMVKSVVSTPGDTTPFRVEEYVNTQKVLGVAAIIAVVDVLIFTALATLGSFLYNLAATVLGGLEVTLAED